MSNSERIDPYPGLQSRTSSRGHCSRRISSGSPDQSSLTRSLVARSSRRDPETIRFQLRYLNLSVSVSLSISNILIRRNDNARMPIKFLLRKRKDKSLVVPSLLAIERFIMLSIGGYRIVSTLPFFSSLLSVPISIQLPDFCQDFMNFPKHTRHFHAHTVIPCFLCKANFSFLQFEGIPTMSHENI